ncbi:MAG: S9 family peptidase [Thermomicrobiales bacterium]
MSHIITADRAVYDLPVIGSPRVSPDGKTVAFIRTVVDRASGKYDAQIWLYTFDTATRRQLTQPGSTHSEPAWSPGGEELAFVASGEGDHSHAICRMVVASGETSVLTRGEKKPASLTWSPDGETLAYSVLIDPANPDETPVDKDAPKAVRVTRRIDYKQDGFGYLDNVRNQIVLLQVGTGERRHLTKDSVDHLLPAWSPDGNSIVVQLPNRNGMLSRCGVIDVATGAIETYGAADGEVDVAFFSPDGSRLFVSADEHGGPHLSGYVIDLRTGAMTMVLNDPEFLIDSATASPASPVWLNDSTVLISATLHGESGLWKVDVDGCNVTQVGLWQAGHGELSLPDDLTFAIQSTNTLGGTVGLVRIDLATGEKSLLFNDAEDFYAKTPAALWEKCPVERDGVIVDAWLIKPADFDDSGSYPLIINIHGGPHGSFGFATNLHAEIMSSRGYLVLLVNPRGSTTYGSAYANAVKHDWGGTDWADLEAVLDSVVARPYVDPDRTGAYGYSYGGYMTSWILGQTDRFKAVVCGAPVFDLESFFGTSDIGHVFGTEQHGGTPWDVREAMFERSPSSHIHKATTPTLIVHGEADERCPIGQGEQMFISLLKVGCETEFVRYPGGYHGFTRLGEPVHRIDYYDRTIAWFDRFLMADAGR